MTHQTSSVVYLSKERLRRAPVTYTITFRHDENGMTFVVYDIADTEKDRLAVAADLEAASLSMREPE